MTKSVMCENMQQTQQWLCPKTESVWHGLFIQALQADDLDHLKHKLGASQQISRRLQILTF